MVAVIDTEEKVNQAIEELAPMLQDGLIVVSDAELIRIHYSASDREAGHGTPQQG